MVGQQLWWGKFVADCGYPHAEVGSKMVLLQLPLASRNSWNHFRSFHHIILIHTRYCRSAMGCDLMHVDVDPLIMNVGS